MKIGVIGCTHIPQSIPSLPEKVQMVFKGMDIILHVGDVTGLATLKTLEDNYTVTIAVCGESDSPEVRKYVEPLRVVEFGGRRIGMVHGDGKFPGRLGVAEGVLSRFAGERLDAIVFGHTHVPYARVHNGVLLFNPGAAAPVGRWRPSVGILDVQPRSISGRYMYL
jgi:putative phosphoesterase